MPETFWRLEGYVNFCFPPLPPPILPVFSGWFAYYDVHFAHIFVSKTFEFFRKQIIFAKIFAKTLVLLKNIAKLSILVVIFLLLFVEKAISWNNMSL
jgi:hypothetical protein